MINHFRALLANVPGELADTITFPGDQVSPLAYTPVALPGPLNDLRGILFGSTPDRFTRNYRLAEYMGILHAHRWAEAYVLTLDPRVTYRNDQSLMNVSYAPQIVSGDVAVTLSGSFTGNDNRGYNTAAVTINGVSGSVTIRNLTTGTTIYPSITIYGGNDTSYFQLPDTGVLASARGAIVGGSDPWAALVNLRSVPSRGIPEIFVAASAQTNALDVLFADDQEPYLTFRNAFRNGLGIPEKLCGILLALGYRTKELA